MLLKKKSGEKELVTFFVSIYGRQMMCEQIEKLATKKAQAHTGQIQYKTSSETDGNSWRTEQ